MGSVTIGLERLTGSRLLMCSWIIGSKLSIVASTISSTTSSMLSEEKCVSVSKISSTSNLSSISENDSNSSEGMGICSFSIISRISA